MIGLQVSVNGQPLYTVGVGEFGLLHAGIDWAKVKSPTGKTHGHLWVGARAMYSPDKKTAHWQQTPIQVGDEVTIKVIETDASDPPVPGPNSN